MLTHLLVFTTTSSNHNFLQTLRIPPPFFFPSPFEVGNTMKQSVLSTALLLFLLFIIFSSKSSARFLTTKQGEEDQTLNEIIKSGTSDLVELEDSESTDLMGVEECEKEDDECLKRRIIAEAHLDYIYTQHHKP